jgi:PAS domain S-box-containing protein
MRINTPVTQSETEFKSDTVLVSRTDTGGRLVFVNKAFIEVSGYTKEELIGQPHNMVRHPDMPVEAFEDLWRDLKAGKPWNGYVKNRSKNGDYYWVSASASPIVENGHITGYISIRTKPASATVAAVGAVYRQFCEGKAKGLAISHGRVIKTSLAARIGRWHENIGSKISCCAVMLCLTIALLGNIGIYFNNISNEGLGSVYKDRVLPLGQLDDISRMMHENVITLNELSDKNSREGIASINNNIAAIGKIWDEYTATYLTPEEKILADRYIAERKKFVAEGLKPALVLAEAGKSADLKTHIQTIVMPLFRKSVGSSTELVDLQLHVSEAIYQQSQKSFKKGIAISSIATLLGMLFAILSVRFIRKLLAARIGYLGACLDSVAKGNLNTDIKDSDDEVGVVLSMIKNMQSKLAYTAFETTELAAENQLQQQATLNRVADDFQASVMGVVDAVSGSATKLDGSATSLSATAEETSRQATVVSAASSRTAENVNTVAAASEELSSSIAEISRQVAESSTVSIEAVREAKNTSEKMLKLSETSKSIGAVVDLINSIAAQTNLLALNATIEAARAGDAGKGFAVVASEVKNLATQTAKATEDISRQITDIQNSTVEAVSAIDRIGKTIERISSIQGGIAAAVEEQEAATKEIARNVQEVSVGTALVSENINGVTTAAQDTGTSSVQVLDLARDLTQQSNNLRGEVEKFLRTVRAA